MSTELTKAMILAAGRGERMMPLTKSTPKPLLAVNGKPLMAYHIEKLVHAGITNLVINHSYLGEQIEQYFLDGSSLGANIHWSRESKPLETAGGIIKALPLLGEQPFLLINGDVWTDIDFAALISPTLLTQLQSKKKLAHLILIPNPPHNALGDFNLMDGMVNNEGAEKYTYAGISVLSPSLFDSTMSGQVIPLGDLLRRAADKNQVSGSLYHGDWQDIGTPERLKALNKRLSNQ